MSYNWTTVYITWKIFYLWWSVPLIVVINIYTTWKHGKHITFTVKWYKRNRHLITLIIHVINLWAWWVHYLKLAVSIIIITTSCDVQHIYNVTLQVYDSLVYCKQLDVFSCIHTLLCISCITTIYTVPAHIIGCCPGYRCVTGRCRQCTVMWSSTDKCLSSTSSTAPLSLWPRQAIYMTII